MSENRNFRKSTSGGKANQSERGTNVPTQPTVPKMPPVFLIDIKMDMDGIKEMRKHYGN